MLALALRDAPEALEADLQRFYQVDLVDLWRGKLTVRKAAVLLRFLPIEAAVWGELQFGGAGWSTEAYLLADLYSAFAGEPHPDHPAKKHGDRERARHVRERLERQRARTAGRATQTPTD